MSKKRIVRSDQDWIDLITECRQSGLPDKVWCECHDIPCSTFYNAVVRLRKKACTLPDRTGQKPVMDLTSHKQDVVQIDIVPDSFPEQAVVPQVNQPATHLDNLHTIELTIHSDISLRISNNADPVLLEKVIGMARRASC